MGVPEVLAGRYEVRGLLGRGGMGDVYDGWDRRLERAVAIKVLSESLANHQDVRTRFELEARAAAVLINPRVVSVYDTGEQDGVPFIVMERLPGRTLADEIAAGPLPSERVRTILLDMLQALAAAHSAGIVHRDIKPSNVLIAENGAAKIADFGIAKSTNRNLTQTGSLVGTASYLSPERVTGAEATPISDLYSVGVVGFEALSGRLPFEADNTMALVRAIMDDPIPSIRHAAPGVDPALASVIDRATSKQPEARYPSAAAMAEALTSRTEELPERTIVLPAPARPAGRPPMGPLIAGAAVLLVLAAVLLARREPGGSGVLASPSPSPSAAASPSAGSELSGVRSVNFRGPGRLEIRIGDESLTVDAPSDMQQHVFSEVSGESLILGSPGNRPAGAESIVYRVGLQHLEQLSASGPGRITVDGVAEPSLTIDTIGSGDTTISGSADSLNLSLTGAGNLDGSGLAVKDAVVDISGSGSARLIVSDTLRATLSGSGSLDYSGDPEVTQRVDGSGRVRRLGDSQEQDD